MAEIVALLVIKVPSNTVTKKPTDYLNVDIDYEYRGPAQRVYSTAVVTQETLLGEFDEIGSTKKVVYVDLPSSDTLKPYTTRVPNLPLSGVAPKTSPYGVKIKAEGTFGTVEAGNKACLYVAAVTPETGTFTVYPVNMPPLYPIMYWCVEWEVNGEFYYSIWALPPSPLTVPSVGEAPLVGKIAALLWTGEGDPIKYGPTIKYTLEAGGTYDYDISGNVLYKR